MKRTLLFFLLFSIFPAFTLLARGPLTDGAPPSSSQVQSVKESAIPVPVPEPSPLAVRYYNSGNILWIVGEVQGLLIPLLILFMGFSAKIRNFATSLGKKWFFIIVIYVLIYTLIDAILNLPFDYYASYIRPHEYGLSNQDFGRWLRNYSISLVLSLVSGALTLWLPYLLIKKSPFRWWLYMGLLSLPLSFLLLLVYPVSIAPLFNDFKPMEQGPLRQEILDLSSKAGVKNPEILIVNKSVDTKALNAYVAGFFNTERIVVHDTLLEKLDRDEVKFVLGHELGHYVLGHHTEGVLFYSLLTMLLLYLIHRSAGYFLHHFQIRFRFHELGDVASLPLIILLMNLFSIVISPMANAYSRSKEKDADTFALELTRNNRAAATSFIKIQSENLAYPDPGMLFTVFRAGHPSIRSRIEFANRYRPYEKGEALQYGDLIGKKAE